MAMRTRPINIQLVAAGTATRVVLKVPNRRKNSTRGHALLSQAGQIKRNAEDAAQGLAFQFRRISREAEPLQPFPQQGERTSRAPDPAADGHQQDDQGGEPENPYDHGAGVASGNLGAEQARQNDEPEHTEHR